MKFKSLGCCLWFCTKRPLVAILPIVPCIWNMSVWVSKGWFIKVRLIVDSSTGALSVVNTLCLADFRCEFALLFPVCIFRVMSYLLLLCSHRNLEVTMIVNFDRQVNPYCNCATCPNVLARSKEDALIEHKPHVPTPSHRLGALGFHALWAMSRGRVRHSASYFQASQFLLANVAED